MKLSLVTPVYNGEKYISETIESVISQEGDFEIEYTIVDGGSTDKTVEIANRYKSKLPKNVSLSIISEKDRSMYDAVNKGFAKATGDIFAWINADDKYLPRAFEAVSKTFSALPEVWWLKGKTNAYPCFIFNRNWIEKGIYGRNAYFINQDSVFWRRPLWEKAGPIDANLRLAGDYDLWVKFAKYTDLWSLDREISIFRTREGQLSERERDTYIREQSEISPPSGLTTAVVKTFFWLKSKLPPKCESFFLRLYPVLFWGRKKHYIVFEDGEPIIKRVSSYIPHDR